MTKFHMRRDYPTAGALLLGAVDHLSGDKAASAQFHGARALSRVDRDDEAIAGYRKVITQFPHSRFAPEAQYLSGWLEYNRGRFRESIPAFEATLKNFGSSAFADDAAWSLAFAHFLLGDAAEAAAGFDRYGRLPPTGIASDEIAGRVKYWRARGKEKAGQQAEAEAMYRDLARQPFSFYGLLARARLKQAGHPEPLALPVKKVDVAAPSKPLREPSIARATELIEAGLNVEAGEELEQNEKEILKHLGGDKALPWLIDLYKRAGNYHRVYRLGESRGAAALGADPLRDEGTRAMWEAAYPRAYQPLVDKYSAAANNPELFLYAIMRKESGFDPHDVSYADARGLLQMIPPTSTQVAAGIGEPFFADQLYEPEINVHLGALYIGQLYGKFGRELQLTAGAYNGGPRMMARWCEQNRKYPTDEFVELIAFPQTREYVKRVTSHLCEVSLPVWFQSVRDSPDPGHQGRKRTDLLKRANERCQTESVPNNCSPWKPSPRRREAAVTRAPVPRAGSTARSRGIRRVSTPPASTAATAASASRWTSSCTRAWVCPATTGWRCRAGRPACRARCRCSGRATAPSGSWISSATSTSWNASS